MTHSIRRPLAAILLALTLGGCNVVYSEKPLFVSSDEAGAPQLRQGIWRSSDPSCRFDERRPVQFWPSCAQWSLVRSGEILELKGKAWNSTAFVLAAGETRVLQAPFSSESGSVFVYSGVRPLRFDATGRIIEFTSWLAQCGPPPPDGDCSKAAEPAPATPPSSTSTPSAKPAGEAQEARRQCVTLQPLPGLEIKDDNCIARDQSAVRNAAAKSEAWDTSPTASHWVRDTLP
jgi:hypothetical protein